MGITAAEALEGEDHDGIDAAAAAAENAEDEAEAVPPAGVAKDNDKAAAPKSGVDLDAEYFMEGVALTYDWLHDQLPPDLRTRVRDTIARQCREVYEASLDNRAGGTIAFQQNHFWFAHLSLILGAAAVYGEVPEAADWLAWAWDSRCSGNGSHSCCGSDPRLRHCGRTPFGRRWFPR